VNAVDRRIVIIGGGTAGTLVANRLHHTTAGSGVRIVVVDRVDTRDPETELLVALGLYGGGALRPPDDLWLREGIEFRHVAVCAVDTDRAELCLADGTTLGYDVLVLATGRHPLPRGTKEAGPDHGAVVYAVGRAAEARLEGAAAHVQAENVADAVRRRLDRQALGGMSAGAP
jgi:NADH dehydrogenase FAD-containing subunit